MMLSSFKMAKSMHQRQTKNRGKYEKAMILVYIKSTVSVNVHEMKRVMISPLTITHLVFGHKNVLSNNDWLDFLYSIMTLLCIRW